VSAQHGDLVKFQSHANPWNVVITSKQLYSLDGRACQTLAIVDNEPGIYVRVNKRSMVYVIRLCLFDWDPPVDQWVRL
jgi:hypothetical protein